MKRTRMLATALILVLVFISACAPPPGAVTQPPAEPAGPKQGGKLVLGQASGPIQSLDPIVANESSSGLAIRQIFSQLLVEGEDGQSVVPEAAAGYEMSDDGLTYTFNLREGLTFSDGNPVTAEDVVFSLQRWTSEGSRWAWLAPQTESITALDGATVEIVLQAPAPSLTANLAGGWASIVPKALVEGQGEAFWDNPVGSGPFMVKEWVRGERINLVANPHYWDTDRPYLEEVEIEAAGDDNNRMLKFRAGEYDIALHVPPNQVEEVSDLPGVDVSVDSPATVYVILINANRTPLDDINVRMAMNYATDKQGIISAVMFGQGQEATSFLPPMLHWNDQLEGYPYDLDKAQEYMAQSSVPEGFSISLVGNSGEQISRETVTLLIDMWGKIGIDLQPDLMERGAALQRVFGGDFDLFLNVMKSSSIDPDLLTKAMLYSKGFTAPLIGYMNEEFDALADETSADPAVRGAAYLDLQGLANEDAPLVLLIYPKEVTALQDHVQGFNMLPVNFLFDLSRIWVDK